MLVLASSSPRRRQLMALGGWTFTLIPADIDERSTPGELPGETVLRLAEAKACAVAAFTPDTSIVIAADTIVVDGIELLGKPADAAQAEVMLRRLRGHPHQVLTGLAALRTSDGLLYTDCCTTDVPMREYSDEELFAYIASGDPMDKAGAYAIQHEDFKPVERLQGCFANVMGLPLCHLKRTLDRLGVPTLEDVPSACQAAIAYECPVYKQVLKGDL